MARTIVGRFDSEAEAQQAASALATAGIDARGVQVIGAETVRQHQTTWTQERKGGGFWNWLFGDVEEEQGRGLPESQSAFYDEALRSGAVLVVVTAPDEQAARVAELMERRGGEVESESATGNVNHPSGMGDGARQAGIRRETESGAVPSHIPSSAATRGTEGTRGTERVLPEVEERVRIGKRAIDRGMVRVYTHVTERPVEEHIRLREERVKVDRRPVDRPMEVPAGAFKEQTIEFKETVEEAVIEKTARVVGEVVVSTDVRERDETVRETVRRSQVEVDRGRDASASAPDSGSFAAMESDYRQHCSTRLASTGLAYEHASTAYRYGHELGGRGGDSWPAVEPEARRRWEEGHPGSWERFRDAIRYGWERARSQARAA